MLISCTDWEILAEMIAVADWELEHYPYPKAHKQQLQQVLVEQKACLKVLKAQATGLMKAWERARGWAPVLESCPNQKTLNIALQLYTAQKSQFEPYPQVFDLIRQVGRQRREYLRSLEVA